MIVAIIALSIALGATGALLIVFGLFFAYFRHKDGKSRSEDPGYFLCFFSIAFGVAAIALALHLPHGFLDAGNRNDQCEALGGTYIEHDCWKEKIEL